MMETREIEIPTTMRPVWNAGKSIGAKRTLCQPTSCAVQYQAAGYMPLSGIRSASSVQTGDFIVAVPPLCSTCGCERR